MTVAELLETVRRVEVRTNRLVNDTMVGAYLSHFKGRGMDFEELREYIPGDEVRAIDWNVTDRMGRPFVKRYREERELAMVLAVDVSASSTFGSLRRSKRDFAAEIAGTLAISASRSSDKVGLLLFTDQIELFLPPRKGRRHILRILREMLAFEPKHRGTNIPAALTFLNHVLHRRSIVFLLTDFLHSFDQAGKKAGLKLKKPEYRMTKSERMIEINQCHHHPERSEINQPHHHPERMEINQPHRHPERMEINQPHRHPERMEINQPRVARN